jgi:hypothetical protein
MGMVLELDQAFETLYKNMAKKMVSWTILYICLYMWQVRSSMALGQGIEILMTIRSSFFASLTSASNVESGLANGQAEG